MAESNSKQRIINSERLTKKLRQLGQVGGLEAGGVSRLALTDADKQGRDLVISWMKNLGMVVSIDAIGNVVATIEGEQDLPLIMIGSHIDSVSTAGIYDGNLGVLAALEVVETLVESKTKLQHPLAVAFFTNEEGARFAPDMMGSAVYTQALGLEQALNTLGIDGKTVAEELQRIGYNGSDKKLPAANSLAAFLELHVEQGPVLDRKDLDIGIVEGVQGISWSEFTFHGTSNHAGTTPMQYRNDAGLVAAKVIVFANQLAQRIGNQQLATVGSLSFKPNLVNVIPNYACFTIDLRNSNENLLVQAENELLDYIKIEAKAHGLSVEQRQLARFQPVQFNQKLLASIEALAQQQKLSHTRIFSGAGHDAQMFAPHCPTAMIFVPSDKGISHNINEYTSPEQCANGANLLLNTVLNLACKERSHLHV